MIIRSRSAFTEAVQNRKAVVGPVLDLSFGNGNGLYSVRARDLARLLERAQGKLEALKMRHVDLQGETDLDCVLEALGRQKSLKSFQAEFCNFSYRIATLVSGLPCLQTLNIVGHQKFRWRRKIPVQMATQLVRGGRLADLRLDTLGNINREPLSQNFFQEVGRSELEVFWCLASNFGNEQVVLVADLLRESTSLTDVRFGVASNVPDLGRIAEALPTNDTLSNLGIRIGGQEDPSPEVMESFLDLVQHHNRTLRDFILARGTQWDADQRRHIPAYTSQEASDVYRKIDYYLSLNRAGRAALMLDTATGEDWLAAITSQWDISVLFYFLSTNPTLVLGGAVPPPSDETRKRDQALLVQRCAALFPDVSRTGTLNLQGPRQVQDALLCLPESVSIQDLSIRFVEKRVLSWMDLAALIRRSGPKLETVLVEGAIVEGPSNERFLHVLSNASNLTHLSFRECTPRGFNASGLSSVLSGLPSFESLGWTGNQEASLSFDAVNQILQHRPIKFLALDNVDGRGLDQFFELLEQSTSLKVLRCETQPQGVSTCHLQQLAQALAINRSLENLQIHVTPSVDLTPLAQSLEHNSTLTGLHITGLDDVVGNLNLRPFVSVLETNNSSLKSFLIGKEDLGAWGARIGQLLRANIARSRPYPLPKACYNPT